MDHSTKIEPDLNYSCTWYHDALQVNEIGASPVGKSLSLRLVYSTY